MEFEISCPYPKVLLR